MGTPVVLVDAFTTERFRGNPAGVCILDGPADDTWMASVAAELNAPETAFCHPEGELWRLRWFSPTVEVNLCGHATLATTYVLATDHGLDGTIRYATRSGVLAAQALDDGVVLDFPADPTRRTDTPDGLAATLGITDIDAVRRGREDLLVVLADEHTVRDLDPDIAALGTIDARAVIVTAMAGPSTDADIVSRVFAPSIGIAEDPVTGSSHCTLASYWAPRLQRDHLRCEQASPRGGELDVRRVGDRVELIGQAVISLRGELVDDETAAGD